MDESNFKKRDVREFVAEHEAWWDSLSQDEREAVREKNRLYQEDYERKNAGLSLEEIFARGVAESMGKPDWTYQDISWTTTQLLAKYVEIIGEGNCQWLVTTQKGSSVRGQVLISPEGMENLKNYG